MVLFVLIKDRAVGNKNLEKETKHRLWEMDSDRGVPKEWKGAMERRIIKRLRRRKKITDADLLC